MRQQAATRTTATIVSLAITAIALVIALLGIALAGWLGDRPGSQSASLVSGDGCGFERPSPDSPNEPGPEDSGEGQSISGREAREAILREAHDAQIQTARKSLQASSADDELVHITVSFLSYRSLLGTVRDASRFDVELESVAHGFRGSNRNYFGGEISARNFDGSPRSIKYIADEFQDNLALEEAQARNLVARLPGSHSAALMLDDMLARAAALAIGRPPAVGFVATGTRAAARAIAAANESWIVGISPWRCGALNVVFPFDSIVVAPDREEIIPTEGLFLPPSPKDGGAE